MASPWDSSSSSLWVTMGQASNVAQLVGVDALGLISMVVQAALAARRHRDACMQLAQHVELVGGLLRELELADLMRREATRRPLEQLRGALRRCYALVTACQDCGYLRRLLLGAWMDDELRAAQHEIDMFIRLVPLIALVDNSTNSRVKSAAEQVDGVVTEGSNHRVRFPTRVLDITEVHVQRARELCNVGEQLSVSGLQEQKTFDNKELVEFCMRTGEYYPGFTEFTYFQIVDATDNFSEKRYLGSGGFATAYKLARLWHTNVIRLLGRCIHGEEKILIYRFMHNAALDHHIFDRIKGPLLDWSKRLKIIKGLVEGLVYLHKHPMLSIAHRDLKPNNILLYCDMTPKISDFGSAKTLSPDVTEERTRRVVGTSGYIAPEYASRGVYSLKTDVFSFGILGLETISGRKNTILDKRGDTVGDLVRDVSEHKFQAWRMWKDRRLHELIDRSLGHGYDIAEVAMYTQVALLCAQEDPVDRPAMTDVAAMLSSESMSLPMEPKEPSVLSEGGAGEDTYINRSSRIIDITITSPATVLTRVCFIIDPEV